MSLFGQVFEKRSAETGNLTDYSDFWYGIGGSTSSSGISVTSQTAMQQWAVFACVTLISNTIGCFPLVLKKKLPGGGSKNATDHPLYYLMKMQPNRSWNSNQFRIFGQNAQLLNGNQYSWIERNRLGVKAIWPLDPNSVTVKRDKITKERIYETKGKNGTGKVTLKQKDVLHIPGHGFDGLKGYSFVTNYAKDVIGRGLSQGEFASKYFKNGIFTSGVIQHPESLGDNKSDFLSAIKTKFSGSNNTGIPLVLEDGMTWNPMKLSLVDQQFLEQEKLNAEHICGMLHVPLHKISIPGSQNSYNNTEQMNRHFLDTTILPWVIADEQCYDTQLLTRSEIDEGYFFKFNYDHFLRPDAKTRAEIAEIRWRMSVPINRYLEKEDETPLGWGDKGFVPLNFGDVENDESSASENDGDERFIRHSIEKRETITAIDKLMENFSPSIRSAAQKVINRETIAVKREAEKQLKRRSEVNFTSWVDSFYSNIDNIIQRDIAPIIRTYWESAADIYSVSIDEQVLPEDIEQELNEYLDGLTRQWVNSSRGQLITLINEEPNNYDAIIERMDEWTEKRAGKVTEQQKRTVPNAVAYFVLGSFGYSLRWTNRGKTCAYCRSLNGKIILRGQNFIDGGSEINPGGGKDPMSVKRNTKYPPLHRGCDCYLRAG
jgi:HK97 family phage portal protein